MRNMRDFLRVTARAGLIGLALIGLAAPQVRAQTSKPGEPRVLRRGERQQAGSGFALFGNRDYAMVGLRLAGTWGGCTDNSSDLVTVNQCFYNYAPESLDNTPNWFGLPFYWAAPASEWTKHQAEVPSLANAMGKGFTFLGTSQTFPGDLLPQDGTLGPFHAGAQSTTDGSCLDFSVGLGPFVTPGGNPLLAASDCPVTWGSQGWGGSRLVDADGYLAYAAQVGDAAFSFDPYRVPADLHRNDKFQGSFQTFGYWSDYSADALFGATATPKSYGNVIPEAMGGDPAETPTRPGWPLGLEAKLDAFSFAAPGMLNTAWYQVTVTNNSRDVYGVGLDYDSLYMGIAAGWLTYEQGTSVYRDPAHGVVRGATYCQHVADPCPLADPQHPADQWGSIPPNGVGAGFNYGSAAVVVLKSPIGDLRNKYFTDPTSPFYGKGDPQTWDDTITFNHGHMCGFHSCSATTYSEAPPDPLVPSADLEQRAFGMVSSTTQNVLGNRTAASLSDHTAWDTWRWVAYPDRNQMDFQKWVPGSWDYNNDGVPDTLFFDDCYGSAGPQFDPVTGHSKPCSVTWSDTLPGHHGNVYSNEGGVIGAGPFRLPADSTVQWVVAVVQSNDSLSTESDIAKAIDHYMAFYLGPEAPPPPTVTSVDVTPGGSAIGSAAGLPQSTVTLYWNATTEDWSDPFLTKFLTDLNAAPTGTDLGNIRLLNPQLADTIAALIGNNVAELYVFKSCDGGSTFTNNADCFGNAATSGGLLGSVGWLPYATLDPDPSGNLPNVFHDENVIGGRTYLYSLVAQSKGLSIPVQTGGEIDTVVAGGDTTYLCASECGSQVLNVAPPLIQTIATATTASNVASVYVPATQQAGSKRAAVALVKASPDFIPFDRMNITATRDSVSDGNYTLAFADSVIVREILTQTVTGARLDTTIVSLVDIGGSTTTLTAVGTPVALEAPYEESSSTVGTTRPPACTTAPCTRLVRKYTFAQLTTVLSNSKKVPLLVTASLSGEGTVPGRFYGIPNFPGFTMSIDNTKGGSFDQQSYLDADGNPIEPLVTPAVTFLPGEAQGAAFEGAYRVTWADQAFGAGAPFTLNFNDPTGTRDAIAKSIADRAVGQKASVDPDLASFLGLPVTALEPANLPFKIENVTDPNSPTPVTVVLTKANKQTSITVGSGDLSLSVPVAETDWVPGDKLMLVEGAAPDFNVTFQTAVLGCDANTWLRLSCNPVATNSAGASGYIPPKPNDEMEFNYFQTMTAQTQYVFSVKSADEGKALARATDPAALRASLDSVKVVPNPFVMFSQFTPAGQGSVDRILFTHVPPKGVLRVFSVSGQFVQQIRWTPEDLNGRGDLAFNLRTREGNEMAAGLYLFVLTAQDNNGRELATKKGKFVLIK